MGETHGPGTPESLLYQLAHDESWQLRANAAWQLGRHSGPPVVDGLIKALEDASEDTAVLMEVVASLDRIRDPAALEALRTFGESDRPATFWEEQCRAAAKVAVARITGSS